jgi:alkylation response protein AidB-like acyl-CoA dehydrogenase
MVLNGPSAGMLVVTARSAGTERAPAGIEVFLVDASSEGIHRTDYPTIDQSRASNLVFDKVRVPATSRLGAPDTNFGPSRRSWMKPSSRHAPRRSGSWIF